MGLRLFFLPTFPGAMFIQEATFIPDSRVLIFYRPAGTEKSSIFNFGPGYQSRVHGVLGVKQFKSESTKSKDSTFS